MSAEETSLEQVATEVAEQGQEQQADPSAEEAAEGTQPEQEQAGGKTAESEHAKHELDRDERSRSRPVQSRIDELTRARYEAQREAEFWKALATNDKSEPVYQGRPKADKYESQEAYLEALTDWTAQQAVAKAMEQREASLVQRAQADAWKDRELKAKAELPDYDQVVGASSARVEQHVADIVTSSDLGPKLAYHFARNPEVLERLNSMQPLQAAREIGRLEAGIASKPVQQQARVTQTPRPVSSIGASGRSTAKDIENMSVSEYEAFRRSQGAYWAR